MMKFFINFLLSNVFFFLISSQIVYEFNRDFELNEKMTEEEIYLKLSYNDIYTYIKIGKQEKQLKVGLSFKDKALVILGSQIKNREVFDETESDSYISFSRAAEGDNDSKLIPYRIFVALYCSFSPLKPIPPSIKSGY